MVHPLLALALSFVPTVAPVHRTVDTQLLRSGRTLAELLYATGLPTTEVQGALDALVQVVNLSKLHAGDGIRIERTDDRLSFLEIHDGPALEWGVRRDGEHFAGFKRDIQIVKRRVQVEAVLSSSLSQAFVDAGQDPQLAMAVADVFACDIDFYMDARTGDRIRAVVDRLEANGRLIGYGEVLAAEYE